MEEMHASLKAINNSNKPGTFSLVRIPENHALPACFFYLVQSCLRSLDRTTADADAAAVCGWTRTITIRHRREVNLRAGSRPDRCRRNAVINDDAAGTA